MNPEAQLFVASRFVCADCGHEIEEDEFAEQRDAIRKELGLTFASAAALLEPKLLRCLDCGSFNVHEIEVDLRDDLLRAAEEAGMRARLAVERNPELRPRVAEDLTEARSHVDALVRRR